MGAQLPPNEAEAALRRQHQRLVNTLESMSDAFVSLDKNWCYTYVNKHAAKMFGRKAEDLIGKHIWTEFPEGIGQPFYKNYYKAVEEQKVIKVEEYYPPWNRWYENRIYPTPDGISIFFQDITEQKQAHEELNRRQHLIENILEAEPGNVYIYDLMEKRNVYTNKEWLTAFGYTSEETKEMGSEILSRVFHPEDLVRIIDHHDQWRSAAKGEVRQLEYRARTKAGEWRWLNSREVAFTCDTSGRVLQILGIAQDISDRKRSERLLAAELKVLEMVSTGASLENTLSTIVESVEDLSTSAIGSILLLGPDGVHMRHGAAPHLPEAYNRALENSPIGPSAGSCGTSAYRRETVIVTDIETDPLWEDHRELARNHGLRACWSTPIMNRDGVVLGTFAMYYREVRRPADEDFKLIERATHLAGIAIEQKRTEAILRESEAQFRNLVEGTHAFLFSTDTKGRITYVNDAAAKALGYTVHELTGRFYLQFVHQDDREWVHRLFTSQLASSDETRYAEFRFEGGNGKKGWLSFLVTPLMNGEQVVGLTGVAQEITERRRSEEALRSSEERFSKAFNLSPIRMGMLRLEDQTIIDINDRLVQEMGISREEAIGRPLFDVASRMDREDKAKVQQLLKERRAVRDVEFHPRTKSGEQRVVLTSTELIEIGGEQCMLWASHDITEQKRVQDALRESEETQLALLNAPTELALLTDTQGTILALNDAAVQRLGKSSTELIGTNSLDIFSDDISRVRKAMADKVVATGKAVRFEDKRAGRCFDNNIYPVFNADGQVTRLAIFARDITESRQAEEELRLSESRYRAVVENQTEFIVRWKPDGVRTFTNEAYRRYFGLTPEQALSSGFMPLVVEEDRPALNAKLSRLLSGAVDSETDVHRVIRPDGSTGWQEWIDKALHDETGNIIEFQSVGRDITERKHADEALKESEERLRRITDNMLDLVSQVDAQGIFRYISPSHKPILGYSPDDLLGRFVMNFVHPEDFKKIETASQQIIEGALYTPVEFRFLHAAGHYVWLESNGKSLYGKDGQRMGTVFAGRDITKRRQAEDALRQSEDRFRTLVEHAPEAIVVLDFEKGVFDDVNEKACRLFRLSREAMLTKGPVDLSPALQPDGRTSVESAIEKIKRAIAGESLRFEWTHQSTDTAEIPCEVYLTRLPSSTRTLLRGSIIDITERKRAEGALKKSHEQLRALTARLQTIREEERTHIAREVHDELGQALTGLKMDLSWMSHKMPKHQVTLLKRTHEMKQLIDSTIVTVRKIASELRPGVLDNLGLVAAVEWQAEEFQKRTDIRCTFVTDCAAVEIDKDRSTEIFRILQETLTNVARHANASQVQIGLHRSADGIILTVQDNGRGITERELVQQKSLGLLGMRERVAMLRGEFTISGMPGNGTRIHVEIPVVHAELE